VPTWAKKSSFVLRRFEDGVDTMAIGDAWEVVDHRTDAVTLLTKKVDLIRRGDAVPERARGRDIETAKPRSESH